MSRSIILGFLLFFVTFPQIFADTPANCTYEDIIGSWKFLEGPRGQSSSVNCGNFTQQQALKTAQIQLLFPNVAGDEFGNLGTWTMVYNQGFEVIINYRKYFVFSNWQKTEHSVKSLCHETKPGWSHDTFSRDWACFLGKKDGPNPGIKKRKNYEPNLPTTSPMYYSIDRDMVKKINEANLSWKAQVYDHFERMTMNQIHRMAGGRKTKFLHRPRPAKVKNDHIFAADKLPLEFDWRNRSGINFVSPVRNQGECGSCYAFASMAMLEARYRILTNNTIQPIFSPQDIVECSEYSQGCDGGFPYLIAGKYGEDFGVVTESCNPYTGIEKNQNPSDSTGSTCSTRKGCRRFFTTDYEYIGGYYGGTNEVLMRMELVKNGPLAVGVEVYDDFVAYKDGVYHHVFSRKTNWKWDPFQLTNHAVLLVGYGMDKKSREPFWVVKNSWGENWGENGFFRIRRGTDECGIESLAMKATPIPTY